MYTTVVVVDVVVVTTDAVLKEPSLSSLLVSEPEFKSTKSSSLPSAGGSCEWRPILFEM